MTEDKEGAQVKVPREVKPELRSQGEAQMPSAWAGCAHWNLSHQVRLCEDGSGESVMKKNSKIIAVFFSRYSQLETLFMKTGHRSISLQILGGE